METQEAKSLLVKLNADIDHLNETLEPVPALYNANFDDKEPEQALEKANLYVMLSYAIDSLLFSYLKLQGVDTSSHEIMNELDRVKTYMAKVKQCSDKQQGKQVQQEKSSLTVDKAAASRLVKRAISSYSIKDAAPAAATTTSQQEDNDNNNTSSRTGKRKKSTSSTSKQKKKKKRAQNS